ncbi:MAG: 30S ribosomal protein S12 methylthiotransferase RimO [Clostridiaceae bacterium]
MTKYKVGLVSLGCDKNRVDSEILLGEMKTSYDLTNDPKEAEIIIVNTCGFIETAKQESIETILEMAKYKNKHNCKLLIATGCLTQRYGKDLQELMPEIDIMLGVNDYKKLNEYIEDFIANNERIVSVNYSDSNINEGIRIITTQKSTAYIRIAEGCDNFCTYCVIPKIRGKFRSRPVEAIVEEAELLVKAGVKEIILVAQDTTRYGEDLYGERKLPELMKNLCRIDDLKWLRVMYCYPEEITDELIDVMASEEKICKYIDMPLQHISSKILKRMGRRTSKEYVLNKIESIRKAIPDVTLRTSLIVGFPGEKDEDFEELKDFLVNYKLEKVGVFKYSQEEGTPASIMDNQVPEELKTKREEALMMVQQAVSSEINSLKIGRIYDILVEGHNGEYYFGRSKEMAPEIDGNVFINSENLNIGEFVKVKIIEALEYDLLGVVFDESSK